MEVNRSQAQKRKPGEMAGERFLTIAQSGHGQGSQNGEKQQALHGLSVVLWVGLTVLCGGSAGRGSYRLFVKVCGDFIRTRAAERGGTSGRGPEKVGTGWHQTSTGTFPK